MNPAYNKIKDIIFCLLTTTRRTYFYDHMEWIDGPLLNIGRKDLTAGILVDHETKQQHIAVVGGTDGKMLDSVELLLQGHRFWIKGIFMHYLSIYSFIFFIQSTMSHYSRVYCNQLHQSFEKTNV